MYFLKKQIATYGLGFNDHSLNNSVSKLLSLNNETCTISDTLLKF